MNVDNLRANLELTFNEAISDIDNYLELLKTTGKNQNYDFINQLSIYRYNKSAIACATYKQWLEMWNRQVIKGSKGIPIIKNRKTDHIFDIKQTTSLNDKNDDVYIWRFDREKDAMVLAEILKEQGQNSIDVKTDIKSITRYFGEYFIKRLDNKGIFTDFSTDEIQKINEFIISSSAFAINRRFGYRGDISENLVTDTLELIKNKPVAYDIVNSISMLNRYVVKTTIKKSKETIAKDENILYNNGDNTLKRESEDIKNETDNLSNRRGIKQAATREEEINTIISNSGGDDRLGSGENTGEAGERGVSKESQKHILDENENELSGDARYEIRQTDRVLSGRGTDTVSYPNSKESRGNDGARTGPNNESLGYGRPNEDIRTGKIRGAIKEPGDDFKRDNNEIRDRGIDKEKEGAISTASFFDAGDKKINSINDIEDSLFEHITKNEKLINEIIKARETLGNDTLASFNSVLQRDYAEVLREVAKAQKNVPEDMKTINDVRKFMERLENRYREYVDEYIKESVLKENTNDYWVVEFNEGLDLIEKEYAGELVTKELLDEIKSLDEKLRVHNETIGKNEYGEITDEWAGYSKFYFDHLVDGETTEHFRIDVGEGNESNKELWDYLYEKVALRKENSIDKKKQSEESPVGNDEKTENKDLEISTVKNFRLKDEFLPENLTQSERLNYNLEAISMLKRVERGERELDIKAQEVLSRYVGWGGLADVFDENKSGQWEVARNFLKENLTETEYNKAKESTLTAFYTPKEVIDGIYGCLSNMGFEGGKILEPSMGIGGFVGSLPETMKSSSVYGVELDSISGRIAQKLYPESKIEIKGFEEIGLHDNYFDLAIGNIPFGDFKVLDSTYDKYNFLIHDYFFAKTIDKVRAGGIIAFITSKGTMDKRNSKVREYIDTRCDFLGAVRLPNNVFKGVAGTEVTSDIIFLKKREKAYKRNSTWIETNRLYDSSSIINSYYLDKPEQIVGNLEEISGKFGLSVECVLEDKESFSENFQNALKNISDNHFYEKKDGIEKSEERETKPLPANTEIKNFSYTIIDNDVYYRDDDLLIKQDFKAEKKEKIASYLNVVKSLQEVIQVQNKGLPDEKLKQSQDKLNSVYDAFSTKYGIINSKNNERDLKEDGNYYLASSLEIIDDKNRFVRKADIFSKRTIKSASVVSKVDTAGEALILSISEKGRVDFNYMESLTDLKREELIEDLRGEIYLDTEARYSKEEILNILENEDSGYFHYVPKDEYLSGNIRAKLRNAVSFNNAVYYLKDIVKDKHAQGEKIDSKIADKLDNLMDIATYQYNALENVIPKALTASEISVNLGASWVEPEYIKQFIMEVIQPSYYNAYNIKVRYSEPTGTWNIEGKSEDKGNPFAEEKYGTHRVNAYYILENALNLRETKVYDQIVGEDGKKKSVLNNEETIIAGQRQELLKEEFENWIFKDKSRRDDLVEIYNIRFNSIRNREYDGSHLLLPGINEEITLKQHQKDAISRILFGGNTLLAHVVGAGKTFDMVASCMESKRLGLSNKALFVVPNHITGQIGRDFMQLYPSANILVANKKDFEPKNRKKFIGKIATGEYDAIIIGHSQFEKIPMSTEYQENHIGMQIDEITEYIENFKHNNSQRFTVKQLEKTKKKLNQKLQKLHDSKKDDVITFEELGVDKLYVDEAHYYKNLYLYTKMQNVAGIGQTEALKSSDMFMKCRYMDEMTGGKGIVFATGTPVSNSMTELYTMQRYLQYDELKNRGHHNFDSWAADFCETKTSFELSPEGSGYRAKTRLAKFNNTPELITTFKEIADIKTADMINLPVPKANFEVIKTEASEIQKEFLKSLSERADKVRDKKVDPSKDNMLKITTDGKKLALDQRLMNENLPDDKNSKTNKCVEKVFNIWEETKANKSTQIIFSDMSTPKDDDSFNIYEDIKSKLISKGVPQDEIAFIHDAKTDSAKENIFAKVREGKIRVLIGSTVKMGAGTNVQDRLIAMHDLDVPWRPSDLEQRSGRIIRQGNNNPEVSIYRYITKDTFDSFLWQTIENKQKFISQIMTSKTPIRSIEDVDEITLNYAEIKALATGNSLIKEKMELDNDVAKLKMLKARYNENKFSLEEKIERFYPEKIEQYENLISKCEKDIEKSAQFVSDDFPGITIQGKTISDKKMAAEKLLVAIKNVQIFKPERIGEYKGFKIEARYDMTTNLYKFYLIGAGKHPGEFGKDPIGNITRLDNVIKRLPEDLKNHQENREKMISQLENAKKEVSMPFEKEEELTKKSLRLSELNSTLTLSGTGQREYRETQEKEIIKSKPMTRSM